LSEKNTVCRIPKHISGRSFSNGILLRGGTKQAVAIRNKNGEIELELSDVKGRNTGKTGTAFINMLVLAFSGLKESFKVFKKNNRISIIRLFKYHGAEHKVIHCYEDGMELNVENAKKCPTYHPRCGSNLAANVLIIEGLICLIVPSKVRNALYGFIDVILFFAALFAGFKISRYAANHNNRLSRVFSLPGRLLQKVTAMEPDEEMLECGIEAAKNLVQSEYK